MLGDIKVLMIYFSNLSPKQQIYVHSILTDHSITIKKKESISEAIATNKPINV